MTGQRSGAGLVRRVRNALFGSRSHDPVAARADEPVAAGAPAGWYWLQHPAVRARVNTLIAGDPTIDGLGAFGECLERLGRSPPLGRCVVPGCGTGGLERSLLQRRLIAEADGFDRSQDAIEEARRLARTAGLGTLRYERADAHMPARSSASYDAAFTHSFLHRVEALEATFEALHTALKPDALLWIDEFVGPSRFQWSDAQIRLGNDWLVGLPDRLARLPGETGRKPLLMRPLEEVMRDAAAPVAVRSAEIRTILSRWFELVDERPYGGTLLHPVLGDIAQNFDPSEPEDVHALERLFALEDDMMANATIGSDFAILTAVRRPVPIGAAELSGLAPLGAPRSIQSTRQLRPPPGFGVPGLDLTVDRADTMLSSNDAHYLAVGQSALAAIERALGGRVPETILDLPCGFGRVTRAIRARYPASAIMVSDLDRPGVDFSAGQFGARPVYSVRDFRELELGERFDVIWVGSLVTHLPPLQTKHLLRALGRHLAPAGRCLVTIQGPSIIPRLRITGYGLPTGAAERVIEEYDRTGFGYRDYDGGDTHLYGVSLTNDHYGISLTGREWMTAALDECDLVLLAYEERGWDDHQDIVVAARRSDEVAG